MLHKLQRNGIAAYFLFRLQRIVLGPLKFDLTELFKIDL